MLRGTKTETRRIAKDGDEVFYDCWKNAFALVVRKSTENGYTYRRVYTVGDTVAIIPGRGKKATGRARIVGLRLEPLLDITEEGARAEGVANRGEYLALWDKIQRTVPAAKRRFAMTNPLVRVITLERIDK